MIMVMNMKKQWNKAITAGLDIPSETLCRQAVVIFRGKEEVTIENHRGILGYEEDLIQVAVRAGYILIHGGDLQIVHMSKSCLRITGTISSMEMG